jgi:hypothetical protein
MAPSKHAIHGKVAVQVRQNLLSTRSRTPIAHQVADNREQADQLDARLLHAGVGRVADQLRGRAGALDVGEDGVALGAQRQGEESGADIGHDAGDDDLLLAGCLDGGAELLVVPGAGWLLA